jgi:NitT/TauT family transport system substrate-binding protein
MTLDPTIKPVLLKAAEGDVDVLRNLDRMKAFDVAGWANDGYLREAFKQAGLDYNTQLASLDNYQIHGHDSVCNAEVTDPRYAGEVWTDSDGVQPFSSAACTLKAVAQMRAAGKTIAASYVFDQAHDLKLFAAKAVYVVDGKQIVPFLLKSDAESYAASKGGKVTDFEDAVRMAATEG